MYPSKEEKAVVGAAEKIMVETMARYDPSHDAFHVQRVRRTAMTIAANCGAKPDFLVVELAALLHDVLDKKYVSAEQANDPYSFFLPFYNDMVSKHGVNLVEDGRGRLIARIVDNVSWSTEKKLKEKGEWTQWHQECVELHCVQDADRLDAIGAFGEIIIRCFKGGMITNKYAGVMRCAAYSSVTNHALHTPAGDPANATSAVQHFYDKLIHIHDRLKTDYGRQLGQKRHKLILDFLGAIEEEFNPPVIAN